MSHNAGGRLLKVRNIIVIVMVSGIGMLMCISQGMAQNKGYLIQQEVPETTEQATPIRDYRKESGPSALRITAWRKSNATR